MILTPDWQVPQPARDVSARIFHAHLPASLNLRTVTRPEWVEYAAWVVSAVVIRRYIDRAADDTTFVPLDCRYINAHIPARVRRPLLDDLLRHEVLECDNLFYFNPQRLGLPGKCLCYRLGERYRGDPIRACPLAHPELLRKVANAYQRERSGVTDPTYLALRAWHDQVEVLPEAPFGAHPLLDAMIDGERRFTVCQQGRVHTNVANLPAQYRQYLRLAGHELSAVDICTSQPLILALLLTGKPPISRALLSGEDPHAVFNPSSDSSLSVFLRDCLDGSVYDRVAEASRRYSRDDVKSLFLAVIYGHPEHMHTVVGEAIRELYPRVFDAVVELNHRLGHGGLPRLMQTIESSVMIERVAGRLVREHPDVPLLTVHDSVVVPPDFTPLVEAIIAEEWSNEFGLAPRMKTSSFTKPQSPRTKRRRRSRRNADTHTQLAA